MCILALYQAIVHTVKNSAMHFIFKNACAELTYLLNETTEKWNRTLECLIWILDWVLNLNKNLSVAIWFLYHNCLSKNI